MQLRQVLTSVVLLASMGCLGSYSAPGMAAEVAVRPAAAASRFAETPQQRDARMQWWREARFGMFVHWGLYSGLAGTWDGKPVGKSGGMEWIQQRVKADTDTYATQAIPHFKPAAGFARQWAQLAKEAGCKYLVFTTKHHEGFGLFDSQAGDYNAGHVLHRDLVKEIVEACRAAGLRVGFYHSVIDWHHDQYAYARSNQLPHPLKGRPYPNGQRDHAQYQAYLHRQVDELVSHYGPVDVLWWDFSAQDFQGDEAWRAGDLMRMVRAKQPGIIMNNRLFRTHEAGWSGMGTAGYIPQLDPQYGDFVTPEQHIPATGMPGIDWETCMTMNTTWGYSAHDHAWKSDETLIRNLIDIASKGGNYLLNIGPQGDGSVPEESVRSLQAIGKWMQANGEAIYATQASPFDKLDWGRCTRKALPGGVTRLYLHVFDWPKDARLVLGGLANAPLKAMLLAGGRELPVTADAHGVAVALPAEMPDKIATVVALDIQGPPQVVKPDPYADETPAQRDARMGWWREAKFGMFIHWGVYAVPAGTWNGKQVPGIGEWIMNRGKIPCADYQAFARQFNPVKYDAEQWVRIAKDAGMKYIVITAKHHDGFTLFDSQASRWNVVQATPYGKDLLQPLADACRKYGLKLGFYYSQAQDWNNGGSAAGGKWDKAQERDMDDYIDKIAAPQVKEILTRYGEFPAVLWWDTPTGMDRQRAEKLIALLKLKPGIIHNNRLGGGFKGDTETPEQHIPPTGFPGRDWETCMTMNGTWGFKSYDDNWKSTETLLRNLIDIASKGGNYLLNVGPTAEGLIPQPSVERLAEVGKWMKVNGDAIYGTTASPFAKLPFNGRCTRKPGKLYLHVFDWPADGKLVVPMTSSITKAYLLADPAHGLPVAGGEKGQVITLPAAALDKIATVVVAEIAGEPQVIVPPVEPVRQAADGSLKLGAPQAILHGELKLEGKHQHQNIGYWLNPADWIEWPIEITQPGQFTLRGEMAAEASAAFEVVVGDQKLHARSSNTGGYGKFQYVELGRIRIAAGRTTLAVKAVRENWRPFNLSALTLTPAK